MNQVPANRDIDPDKFHELYKLYISDLVDDHKPGTKLLSNGDLVIYGINYNILMVHIPSLDF